MLSRNFLLGIGIGSGEFVRLSPDGQYFGRMTAPVTRSGEMTERVADGIAAPIAA
jgi:hypothetical protein